MNPVSTFRSFRDLAAVRPLLVGGVGLGLLGEAGRVGYALWREAPVTVFGHSGAETWDTAAEGPWVAAYVAWVGLCGLVALRLALTGRRARPEPDRPDAPAEPPAAAVDGSAGVIRWSTRRPTRVDRRAGSGAGGAVLWRRR